MDCSVEESTGVRNTAETPSLDPEKDMGCHCLQDSSSLPYHQQGRSMCEADGEVKTQGDESRRPTVSGVALPRQ